MKNAIPSSSQGIPSQYDIVNELCGLVGLKSDQAGGQVKISGADPIVDSPHRLGDVTAAALATMGISLGSLWRHRTGETQDVSVDIEGAILQLSAAFLSQVDGFGITQLLDDPGCWETNDFYKSKTGRYVFIVNSLPRLRDIACTVLDCPPTHAAYQDRVSHWDPFELEEAISSRGGCCVAVRTESEWAVHPQGQALASQPVIRLERVGDSELIPFAPEPSNVFSGLRVLDNTHIIAGPVSTRIMAEYGAEVLHISRPGYADPSAMTIETGLGKRNAYCRLDHQEDIQRLEQLLDQTDVWVNSYLNLDQFGFSSKQLAASRPGLITLDFSCYGDIGPWAGRGGFDQLAQAATGFSAEEGGFDSPKLPATHLVNDYLAAILGVIGISAALQRRAIEGGSWQIHINLAQVCTWVRRQGILDQDTLRSATLRTPQPSPLQTSAALGSLAYAPTQLTPKTLPMQTISTAFGSLTYLPTQLMLSRLKPHFAYGSTPWGVDPLSWSI